jgi:thioesterase domain-containing protein/acyl carrier protein
MIGRPLPNVRAYVLDGRGSLLPVGMPGELYLGGPGVARGYLGRAGMTAEKFVPDAFGGETGARLYRTGDRARWRVEGELEFLGRVDHQVKIRGFRVELGEVEAVLLEHAAVRQAVVVAREDVPGDRRLVAYLVMDGGAELPAAELRARLRERLPEYMVPSAFVPLAGLPLTPIGKVDRRALPAPERAVAGEGYLAPRDGLETTLTGIFEEVLGVARMGLQDSFFEMGGHSLLAVQLMSRVEKATGVRLPVAALFRAPTVERLAEEVRRGGGESSLLVPIRAKGSRPPIFLVHPVGGSTMAYVELAELLGPDQPVFALRARGTEPGEKPNWSVEEMAGDYLVAMRKEQPAGPYRLGGWSMGGVIAFEMARQLEAAGEKVEALVLLDSQVPWLHDPGETMPSSKILLVQLFAQDLGLPGDELPPPDPDGPQSEVAYLNTLLTDARSLGMIPRDMDLARIQHLYGIFRINMQALYDYRPQSYGGGITLLRAKKRKLMQRLFEKKTVGWQHVAGGEVEVRKVPGTHYTMLRRPHVEKLAREVERALG